MNDPYARLLARARSRVGTALRRDKYTLTALLGVGSVGSVYEAVHRSGSGMAVKVLHEELASREDLRARFLKDGYLANRVGHPGLVRVLDDDIDDDNTTFLVMELLRGTTVAAEWEASGRVLRAGRVVEIATALLDVLEAIHAKGILHGDVKSANLLWTLENQIKVLDLGTTRLLMDKAPGPLAEVDPRSDLYDVASLMFNLLSGHPVREVSHSTVGAPLPPARPRSLREVWPRVPVALAQVVDAALSLEDKERWATASDMRTALVRATSYVGALSMAPRFAEPPSWLGPKGAVVAESASVPEDPATASKKKILPGEEPR